MNRLCWILAGLVTLAGLLPAQPLPVPVPPPPQAPTLNMPLPLGVQRGQPLELTLTGNNLANPVSLWTSFPAKVTIPDANNNGKEDGKLTVRLEVPADAPLGYGALRLVTRQGVSNLRLFCIDELPQVVGNNANRTRDRAMPVPVPCVVVSRIDNETSEYFRFSARAGQRLSFEVIGHRLGSPLDPILTLYDANTGRELGVYNDDALGLQTDARLTHTFKADGDYLVEVRDSIHRGGGDYYYRLRIGDFPCVTTTLPAALKRGSKAVVQWVGPMIEGVPPVEVVAPADPLATNVYVVPRSPNGLAGWPVSIPLSEVDELVEQEPNNQPQQAQRLPIPCGVTGRFLERKDIDHYSFSAKKGQKLSLTVQTAAIGSAADVFMIVRNAKGAELARSDPNRQPTRIELTVPEDGDYTVALEHLNYLFGPLETYRLLIEPAGQSFEVQLALDRCQLAPGTTTVLPVLNVTRNGYAGPIELTVSGHPGLSGRVVIPAGATDPPPNQSLALLPVTAQEDLPVGLHEARVLAKALDGGQTTVATILPPLRQSLANLPYPPRELHHRVAVGATEKPAFRLATVLTTPDGVRGLPFTATVKVQRDGFDGEITLTPVGLPPNVGIAGKLNPIGKDADQTQIGLNLTPNAPLGEFVLSFIGKTKVAGKDYSLVAAPATLRIVLPFTLQVAGPIQLQQNGKATLRVEAVRQGGYNGPINLEVKNLPAGVAVKNAPIPAGQNAVELELTANANAAVGEKADVLVTGTATAAGNQQANSPHFVVSVAAAKQ